MITIIEAILPDLNTNKAGGPDKFPSYVLKHWAYKISPILIRWSLYMYKWSFNIIINI